MFYINQNGIVVAKITTQDGKVVLETISGKHFVDTEEEAIDIINEDYPDATLVIK